MPIATLSSTACAFANRSGVVVVGVRLHRSKLNEEQDMEQRKMQKRRKLQQLSGGRSPGELEKKIESRPLYEAWT